MNNSLRNEIRFGFSDIENTPGVDLTTDLEPDADAASTAAAPADTNPAEYPPPGSMRSWIFNPTGLPSVEMLYVQGRVAIIGLIHLVEHRTSYLSDNCDSGAVCNCGGIEKVFLPRQKSALRCRSLGHRSLIVIQGKLQYLQLGAAIHRFRL